MTTYCGWQIPGYPIYVCIRDAHPGDPKHEPKWLTNEQQKALVVMRRHGRVEHPARAFAAPPPHRPCGRG